MLSANALKLLACGFMLIDHAGILLFPKIKLMRIIGRLAFPVFAFFIAEGCRHTRSKLKHVLSVFVLGAVCQTAYVIYSGVWLMNILLTFSVSILLIYLLQNCVKKRSAQAWIVFAAALAGVYTLTCYVDFDYGFTGIIAPLFAVIPDCFNIEIKHNSELSSAVAPIKLGFFTLGIMLTCTNALLGKLQFYALLSILLLAVLRCLPIPA